MKKYLFIIIVGLLFAMGCDFYPDWHRYVKYSDVYPVCGEYMVKDYDVGDMSTPIRGQYHLYIYNKSFNPTKDSIWIDNKSGHPAGTDNYPYKYKVKAKADTVNLTFDVEKAGNVTGSDVNPLDSCIKVTITNSKIWDMSDDITDPTPDSIYFEVYYYDAAGNEMAHFITAGHRKTGWEEPNYEDPM